MNQKGVPVAWQIGGDALLLSIGTGCESASVKRPNLRMALALYGLGLLVFGLLAGPRLIARPPNEFVALAEAWLAGRLDIAPQLAPFLDLAEFGGRHFVPYPPAAAALYTPFVALFGRGVLPWPAAPATGRGHFAPVLPGAGALSG